MRPGRPLPRPELNPDCESRYVSLTELRKVLLLGLVLTPLVAQRSEAQTVPSVYEYIDTRHSGGVFGGYLWMPVDDRGLLPVSAPIFGARYGIRLSGPVVGDVELGLVPTTRTIYEALRSNVEDPPLAEIGETNTLLLSFQAGLRLHVTGDRTWHGLTPYLLLSGGGVGDLTPSDDQEFELDESELFRLGPSFAIGGGAGTELYVTERISLRAEFRDYLWRVKYPIGLTGGAEEETAWKHNFSLTLGSAINF